VKLRVLGSSGAEFPKHNPPGFLIDGRLLLDAGTIGAALSEKEQWKIRHILLTHAHLDHIRGIPFLADNLILRNRRHTVSVLAIPQVINTLKRNLLNDRVWPDFTVLPTTERAVLRLGTVRAGSTFAVDGYTVVARRVSHSVPATGYVVEDRRGRRLLYTGDTGPTEAIWKETANPVHTAIVEVSMPNRMKAMALKTGHLTASLLKAELKKMKNVPGRILITHPKPQYLGAIREELRRLGVRNLRMLRDGEEYTV
jgi:ribonuclease BN (tRNA processing enzyme)